MSTTAVAVEPKAEPKKSLDQRRKDAEKRHKKFRRTQFIKKVTTTVVAGVAAGSGMLNSVSSFIEDGPYDPGIDRWSIKTSITTDPNLLTPRVIDIKNFEKMPPPAFTGKKSEFDKKLIQVKVGDLQEGQIVTTTGYVHLVSHEKEDSDYHIQMNEKPTNKLEDLSPCLIVEVPHPLATNDPILRAQYAEVRAFIRENFYDNKKPNGKVDVPLKVTVTGQLFYDLHHHSKSPATNPGGGRGKSLAKGFPMHATTVWEIHPVTNISLAQ